MMMMVNQHFCFQTKLLLKTGLEYRAWEPKLYHNLSSKSDLNSLLVSDLILYSTAAPTFFPSVNKHIGKSLFLLFFFLKHYLHVFY